MIFEKLISIFFSIPIFKSFDVSSSVLESIESFSSYFYQINSFCNLDLLLNTFFLFIGLLFLVAIANIIKAVL